MNSQYHLPFPTLISQPELQGFRLSILHDCKDCPMTVYVLISDKEFTVGHCLIPENVSQNVSPCNKVNKMSNVRELNQRKGTVDNSAFSIMFDSFFINSFVILCFPPSAVRRQLFSGQGSQNETTGTLYVSPEQRSECCIAVCQSGSNKHDSSGKMLFSYLHPG